jgi:hypothetical protein
MAAYGPTRTSGNARFFAAVGSRLDIQRVQSERHEYDDGERYLIDACTVITEVPEAVGPCPVALMAKASLPLYLALALYS